MAEGWRDWLTAWEGYRFVADDFRELDDERVLVLQSFSGQRARPAAWTSADAGQGSSPFPALLAVWGEAAA
jgi:hypothetical protein